MNVSNDAVAFIEPLGDFKPPEHNLLSNTSEVEVRCNAETPDRTRLELEHRPLDRHRPGWESSHDGIDGDAGWPLNLAHYADLVAGDR
jgi:hypothetical protein